MSHETRHTILLLLKKGALLAAVLVVLGVAYRLTRWPHDLKENCTLMERSLLPMQEGADIIYLGESSNHAVADDDSDKRFISDMIADRLPEHRVANMDKDACHAGVYYDIMRNVPSKAPVRVAVVTVNMRSFTAEWIYSSLEVALRKEQVYMKKAPALWKRMLVAFKAYPHWSEQERSKMVRHELRHQRFTPPEGLPYSTAAEWDKGLGREMSARGIGDDTIALATHYVKCFACDVTEDNPRIRDLDHIVDLCRKRGWITVFNILPDNEEQMSELVGPELVALLRRNGRFVEERYRQRGVVVVNNQGLVDDANFRDRDYPTEHYRQAGRQTIADRVAVAIRDNLTKQH